MKNLKSIICRILITTLIVLISIFTCVYCNALGEYNAGRLYDYIKTQKTSHEIAELARSLGLAEKDPIIVRAKELWLDANEKFIRDRDIIATVVFNEAGYGGSDRHMELVAAVVCNRVKSSEFPNTVYEVVIAPKQYKPEYVDPNSYHGQRARKAPNWEKCQAIAAKALRGEIVCPSDVFFQANFIQGKSIYEIHYTSYSTTWFCYG